jgi:hypothetical protein
MWRSFFSAILLLMLHWRAATSVLAWMVCLFASFIHEASAADLANAGVCMQEGAKVVGVTPVQIGKQVPQPRKIRHVPPEYPALPAGTTARGVWIGELLADPQGAIVRIWSIREFEFNPPFPPFNRAIEDAIRQWRFEPLIVKGQRMPACMTVSIGVNWA